MADQNLPIIKKINGYEYTFVKFNNGKILALVKVSDKDFNTAKRVDPLQGSIPKNSIIFEQKETGSKYILLGDWFPGQTRFTVKNSNDNILTVNERNIIPKYFGAALKNINRDVNEVVPELSSQSVPASSPLPSTQPRSLPVTEFQETTEAEIQRQQAEQDKKVLADTIVSAADALDPNFSNYKNQDLANSAEFISNRLDKNFDEISKIILPETDTQPKESLAKRIQEIGITENVLNDPRLTEEQRELLRQYQNDTEALNEIANELKDRVKENCPKSLELGNSWSKATPEQLAAGQKGCKDGFNYTEVAATLASIEKQHQETGDPCGKGVLASISNALTNFFDTLKGLKKYYNLYVQKTINKISNLTSLVSRTSQIIAAVLKLLVQRMRNYLLNLLRKAIEKAIDKILTKLSKALKNTVIKTIVDSLICKFTEIIKGLRNFVVDFLYALIGNVINAPICAVEQFTNTLINTLTAKIDTAIQPVIGAINDVLGGVVKIAGQLFQAVDFILGFESFLCSRSKCPQVKAWRVSAGAGPTKSMEENWEKTLSFIPDAAQLEESILAGADQAISGLLPGVNIFGEGRLEGNVLASGTPPPGVQCFPGAFRCGPPKVEFFGGGGIGAIGSAVVNSIGEVVGVDLTYGGAGYTAPPFVTFNDTCSDGNPAGPGGFGASGYTVINNEGEVVKVVMVSTGSRYLNNVPGITEFDDRPVQLRPDEEVLTREYVTCLDEIQIVSTGIGYLPTDSVSITPDLPGLQVKVQITEAGQIVAMQVLNSGCGFAEIPEITINSDTGVGLEVRPVMRFIERQQYLKEQPDFIPSRLIKVIDCVTK